MSHAAHLTRVHQRDLESVRAQIYLLQRRELELQSILAGLQAVQMHEAAERASAPPPPDPPPSANP